MSNDLRVLKILARIGRQETKKRVFPAVFKGAISEEDAMTLVSGLGLADSKTATKDSDSIIDNLFLESSEEEARVPVKTSAEPTHQETGLASESIGVIVERLDISSTTRTVLMKALDTLNYTKKQRVTLEDLRNVCLGKIKVFGIGEKRAKEIREALRKI